jgi:histidinol phosphatase-like PHP family hydrolase
MDKFEIVIASIPSKENLVAEIYYNNLYWAQISQETEKLMVRFYPHENNSFWEFNLNEAIETLEIAKKRMLDLGNKR